MSPDAKRQLNFLASTPNGSTTVLKDDLREILMETGGNMLACGRLYDLIAHHLGAGVYKLSLRGRP
jgi:hypothetical protein